VTPPAYNEAMADVVFIARVAALLVARAADADDMNKDAQRVLRQFTALVPTADTRVLAQRLAADHLFADAVRALILEAYAIPILARELPDPSPMIR